MSVIIKIDARQLPHGEGLALPTYQSEHAAGLDLLLLQMSPQLEEMERFSRQVIQVTSDS